MGNFTVFAPDNTAFSKVDASTLAGWQSDIKTLRNVLWYHVVPTKILSSDFAGRGTLMTVNGLTLPYSATGATIKIGNATITKADIEAKNGVIHKIDAVLAPTATPNSNTLSAWDNAFSKAGYEIVTPFKQNLGVISGTVNDGAAKLKPYKYDISIKEVATRDEAKAAFNAAITKAQQQGYQSGSVNIDPDKTWSGYLGNQGFQSDKIVRIHIEEPDTLWTQVWGPFVIVPGSHTMYYVETTYSTTI